MLKIRFLYFVPVLLLLLSSCGSPLFAPATPTVTATPTSSSTPTLTPSPTATSTLEPTATATLAPGTIQNREQFKEMVVAGTIKCQGYEDADGTALLPNFIDAVIADGVVPRTKYILGAGIPSTDDPRLCLFMIAFPNGQTVIVYRDSETGEFVKLTMLE